MIVNQTGGVAELLVMGDIGDAFFEGVTAKMFADELAQLADVKHLTVKINSAGGLAFDGITIMNALKSHPAHVTTEVLGLAASAASIVAMGGDEIVMHKGSMMMIHLPYSIMFGTAAELRSEADVLDKLTDNLVKIYKAQTGETPAKIKKLLEAETWMSAEEAVQMRFADKVIDAPAVKAKLDPSRFRNCPRDWLAAQEPEKPLNQRVDPWRLKLAQRRQDLAGW